MSTPAFDADLLTDVDTISHLTSPIALARSLNPLFRIRKQQTVISNAYMDALTGRGPRFIGISIPQQFGKTEMSSIHIPMHYLEMHALSIVPGGLVGLMSYEDALPMTWSTRIRRTIDANSDHFNSQLRKDSKAAGFWQTEQNGGILAIGVGGSLQGRPLSLVGIDDPTKSLEMALSPLHQDRIWDHWTSVIYGRLQPWSLVLVTMARMAPDDFMGRLKSDDYEGDPSDWRFIEIPYICDSEDDALGREIGEPMLRPQADQTIDEALEEAENVKKSVSTYAWNALWQQAPSDPNDAIFPESKWRYYGGDSEYTLPDPDEFDVVVMTWDMAFKDESYHDYVVGQAWGAKGEDRYLVDQVRGHWGFTETCSRVVLFAERIRRKYPKCRIVLVEDKANGTAVIDSLRSKVGGLIPVTPLESKLSRAWAVQPLLLGGNLYIPAHSQAQWVHGFTREWADFRGTGAGHDDQVDAGVQVLRFLMDYAGAPAAIAVPSGNISNLGPIPRADSPLPFRQYMR